MYSMILCYIILYKRPPLRPRALARPPGGGRWRRSLFFYLHAPIFEEPLPIFEEVAPSPPLGGGKRAAAAQHAGGQLSRQAGEQATKQPNRQPNKQTNKGNVQYNATHYNARQYKVDSGQTNKGHVQYNTTHYNATQYKVDNRPPVRPRCIGSWAKGSRKRGIRQSQRRQRR